MRGLGGDELTEWSLASRTGWLDLHARGWWDEALAWSGAAASLLPADRARRHAGRRGRARRCPARAARCSPSPATTTSAPRSAPARSARARCSTRAARPRRSSGRPRRCRRRACARPSRSGINVGWHAVPGRQCLLGSIRSGAGLEHVMSLLGVAPADAAGARGGGARGRSRGGIAVAGIGDERCTITGVGAGRRRPGRCGAPRSRRRVPRRRTCSPRWTALAGPRARLVVAGGWADGEAARAVKAAHLGAFDDGRLGVRGRARRGAHGGPRRGAGRAAGVSGWSAVPRERRPARTSTAGTRGGRGRAALADRPTVCASSDREPWAR